jgi:aspartate aminotransferase
MSSFYSGIQKSAPDAVFGVQDKYNEALKMWMDLPDPERSDNKKPVSLIIGAYRDEDGRPWPLPSVRKVELELASDSHLSHEYLPMTGIFKLKELTQELIFGKKDDDV